MTASEFLNGEQDITCIAFCEGRDTPFMKVEAIRPSITLEEIQNFFEWLETACKKGEIHLSRKLVAWRLVLSSQVKNARFSDGGNFEISGGD